MADIDEAIAFVNDRPRPLALYYFDSSARRIEHMLASTVSGGVCVNDTLFHYPQESLPFGGVGPSGMGAYHGRHGFDTFTHRRSIYRQSALCLTPKMASPPYGGVHETLSRVLIG